MISCAIDAKEERYILVTYITGIFLHAEITADIPMQLEGNIKEFIVKLETRLYQK